MGKGLKLNLGCGTDIKPKAEGWLNADIAALPGVDAVFDFLRFPWPFPDDHFEHAFASHVLEHVPHSVPGTSRDGFVLVVEELWRVLEPGGTLEVRAPHHLSPDAWIDPTHTRVLHTDVFEYFTDRPGFVHHYSPARFEVLEKRTVKSFRVGRWNAGDLKRVLGIWDLPLPFLRKPGEVRFTLRAVKPGTSAPTRR